MSPDANSSQSQGNKPRSWVQIAAAPRAQQKVAAPVTKPIEKTDRESGKAAPRTEQLAVLSTAKPKALPRGSTVLPVVPLAQNNPAAGHNPRLTVPEVGNLAQCVFLIRLDLADIDFPKDFEVK